MSVLDVIRARRARAAAPAPVANVASCGNGFATPRNAPKSLIHKDLSGCVANVASVARKIDEVEREAQSQPTPSIREAHEAYMLHHWRCPTCCAAGQGCGQRCAEGARAWDAYSEAVQHERADREAAKQAAPEPEPPAPDPRLSWGHYTPATAAEIARMLERTEMFERAGLTPDEVDLAVDRLHLRDRDLDDRHLCLECRNVRADRTGWRCASLGPIPRAWVVHQLQRCPSFLGVDPCN
jgi:hypothetical protein